jgi:hypothetical protein
MSSNVKFVVTIVVGSILFEETLKLEQVFSITGVIIGKHFFFTINFISKNSF